MLVLILIALALLAAAIWPWISPYREPVIIFESCGIVLWLVFTGAAISDGGKVFIAPVLIFLALLVAYPFYYGWAYDRRNTTGGRSPGPLTKPPRRS